MGSIQGSLNQITGSVGSVVSTAAKIADDNKPEQPKAPEKANIDAQMASKARITVSQKMKIIRFNKEQAIKTRMNKTGGNE